MVLLEHLEEVDGCLELFKAEHFHAHEIVEKGDGGNSVLNSLFGHFLVVAVHEDILWVGEADDLKGVPFLDQYVGINLDDQAFPQLQLHQDIRVNDYLL